MNSIPVRGKEWKIFLEYLQERILEVCFSFTLNFRTVIYSWGQIGRDTVGSVVYPIIGSYFNHSSIPKCLILVSTVGNSVKIGLNTVGSAVYPWLGVTSTTPVIPIAKYWYLQLGTLFRLD